ncbi:MAG TPA: ornithine acetyltransferase, partial [Verrucomicrobiales bacterium]|nr:ornithine acetyltransferase [Verrucomicrobiales bacterium]
AFAEQALELPEGTAFIGSTGRIGVNLPMDEVRAGIVEAATLLSPDTASADHAAEA